MRQFSSAQIVLGGCLLAFGASFLNTGFILSAGTSVSHLTGDISRIGSGLSTIGQDNGFHIVNVAIATLGFILGATISGFLLHHPTVEIKLPYGRILSSLGIILVAAHFAYGKSPLLTIAIASAVCGAQNALASRYRGVVLRTTHLTGLFTDFGIHLGMKLRGHNVEPWKLLIPVCITFSFLAGAVTSTRSHSSRTGQLDSDSRRSLYFGRSLLEYLQASHRSLIRIKEALSLNLQIKVCISNHK